MGFGLPSASLYALYEIKTHRQIARLNEPTRKMFLSSLFSGTPDIGKLKAKGDVTGLAKAMDCRQKRKGMDTRQKSDMCSAAADALKQLDPGVLQSRAAKGAVGTLVGILTDNAWAERTVREAAAWALGEIGDHRTVPLLIPWLVTANDFGVYEAAVAVLDSLTLRSHSI
jgi:hypothetical protein